MNRRKYGRHKVSGDRLTVRDREYNRSATCRTIRNGNRWIYAEYDLEKTKESVLAGRANMGTRMKLMIGKKWTPQELTRKNLQETPVNIGNLARGNQPKGWWAILDSDQ